MPNERASRHPQLPPKLRAGERWTLSARLKRAHGNANFGLRDSEVTLLERSIHATGSVSSARLPRRLGADAKGPLIMIDRMRAHVRERIETVLERAPHRGIIVALAVGAQDAVSDEDWAVMRATGRAIWSRFRGCTSGLSRGWRRWSGASHGSARGFVACRCC